MILHKQIISWIIFILISFSSTTYAVSFDCRKAKILVEKEICSDAQLSKFDEQLAKVYKSTLKDSANRRTLRTQQRRWLKYKRNKCQTAACLKSVYQNRIHSLTQKKVQKQTIKPKKLKSKRVKIDLLTQKKPKKQVVNPKPLKSKSGDCQTTTCLKKARQVKTDLLVQKKVYKQTVNPTGKYEREDKTAMIKITALPKGRLHVSGQAILVINAAMERVRTGTIEGTFPLGKDLILHYKEKTSKNDEGCQLNIIFLATKLRVSDDNEQCGGVGVSFNGEYKRITKEKQ